MATNKNQTALHLTNENLIGTGGMRRCYRHPHISDRCAKVYRPLAEIPWNDFAKRTRIWMGAHSWTQHINIPNLEGEMANKEFIKISRWSAQARRRKLQRRINRVVEQLSMVLWQ